MRRNYLGDLRSKFALEHALDTCATVPTGSLDLSGLGLTSIHFIERLSWVEELDLSGNQLTSVDAFLPFLTRCKAIKLNGNPLSSLPEPAVIPSSLKSFSSAGIALNEAAVDETIKAYEGINVKLNA
jgi:hypothetical protein